MGLAGIVQNAHEDLYSACMDKSVQLFISLLEAKDTRLSKVLSRFKLLIIDEFQDLDNQQFTFVKHFKRIVPDLRIIAIGDLAQNIYRFRGTSNEFLRTLLQQDVVQDIKSFTLTTNFRSSKSILNFVNYMFTPEIRENYILPMCAPETAIEGHKPKYFEFAVNPGKGMGEYEERVADEILPIILRAKKDKKSVVLIFPIVKCISFQLITSLLRQSSKKMGYKFDLHQIAKEDETSTTVAFAYDPRDETAPVQFSTFHASKGLEWDIVIIINFTDGLFDVRDGDEDTEASDAEKTNLAYVGVTRAIEELYIFGNANHGGRNRLLARHGDKIHKVLDITLWGTESKEFEKSSLKPMGVRDLLRKLSAHQDLNERIQNCSKNILSEEKEGMCMNRQDIYHEMKIRNRELSFGTYIDWKIKNSVCHKNTFQERMLELIICLRKIKWTVNKSDFREGVRILSAIIDMIFRNADYEPRSSIENYTSLTRYVGMSSTKRFAMVPTVKGIYYEVEEVILTIEKKENRTLEEEYILSQSKDFYTRGTLSEIQAVGAPTDSFQGLPEGFHTFVEENQKGVCDVIKDCIISVNSSMDGLICDVLVETESLILGEIDLYSTDGEGTIIEIKCGTAKKAIELRDTGNCKNLLQLLSYVAMARHGTIPYDCRWGFLVNPLTGAWEKYDFASWPLESSLEFMACLEELRERL